MIGLNVPLLTPARRPDVEILGDTSTQGLLVQSSGRVVVVVEEMLVLLLMESSNVGCIHLVIAHNCALMGRLVEGECVSLLMWRLN